MNELLKSSFFNLLVESAQVTNDAMQSAYESFMEQVETVSQSEQNYSDIYRMLNITRIELVSIQALYRHEQGKKMRLNLPICKNL